MKYKLCYFNDNKWTELRVEELDYFKKYDKNNLSFIDGFTMNFYNDYSLIEYLYSNKVIPTKNIILSITSNKNGYNKPIYMGEKLMHQEDKQLYNIYFIVNEINNHIYDRKYIEKFIRNYMKKYMGTGNDIAILLSDMYNVIKEAERKHEDILDLNKSEYYDLYSNINAFINYELYNSEAKLVDNKVRVKIKEDKDGNIKLGSYRKFRDMINLIKQLNPNLLKNINDYNNRIIYDEDNLCEEDYKRMM